jgi:hypothetical protein
VTGVDACGDLKVISDRTIDALLELLADFMPELKKPNRCWRQNPSRTAGPHS